MPNQKPDYVVYTIVENDGSENYWQRLGSAWINKDNSINLSLNSLPLNGKSHIRASKVDVDSEG